MGVVYEAENLRIGRRCAVKVLHPPLSADAKMRIRLFREVQATSRINHPNVVEIYDYGSDPCAGSYLVMEYLEGQSLARVIRNQGRLGAKNVCKIAVQLAAALVATHAEGLIHRDLKPSNIRVLPNGRIKVLDFGLVKPYRVQQQGDFVTISTDGLGYGTPWYMSPEQASSSPLDPRSDIYSLGIVLYEMVTGKPPFVGASPFEVIQAQLKAPVPLPSSLSPPVKVVPGLEVLLLKCLRKRPQERPQSMAELMDQVYGIARSEGIAMIDLDVPALQQQVPGNETESQQRQADTVQTSSSKQASGTWRVPIQQTHDALAALRTLGQTHIDEVVSEIAAALPESISRYKTLDDETLQRAIRLIVTTALEFLTDSPPAQLPPALQNIAAARAEQAFTLAELVGGLWIGYRVTRDLVRRAAGSHFQRYAELERCVDARILPFVLRLVDCHIETQNQRLSEATENLARRNRELEQLKDTLGERMRLTTTQLANAERLKGHIFDSISSGLVLVERRSNKVLLFNRAMEKLTGHRASDVYDRPMDEVLRLVDGVPVDEFFEQLRYNGQVGLRKLTVRFASGQRKALYIRGQLLKDDEGATLATLFVVDDVTDRDRLVSAFGRYLPRAVSEHILRRGATTKTGRESYEAAVLAVHVHRPPFEVVVDAKRYRDWLNAYVTAITGAAQSHHGAIHRFDERHALVCFQGGQRADHALSAARAIIQWSRHLSESRGAERQCTLGCGIDEGHVWQDHAGDEHRMVYSLAGIAVDRAQTLCQVAADHGGVLVTSALARPSMEAGPQLPLAEAGSPKTASAPPGQTPLKTWKL